MPLAILAAASAAVSAIQQGCELYKEYKGVVLQAKATFDEVKGQVEEVVGLWSFLKSKLFPTPLVLVPKRIKTPRPALSESTITVGLVDNLKVFFRCLEQLEQKVRDAEEASLDVDANYLESAINIEFAMSEVIKLQKTIRETMVYQSPAELGGLYTKVVERVGLIKEQQQVAYLIKLRERRDEQWRRQRLLSNLKQRIAWVVIMGLIILETWGLIIAILLARQPI